MATSNTLYSQNRMEIKRMSLTVEVSLGAMDKKIAMKMTKIMIIRIMFKWESSKDPFTSKYRTKCSYDECS